MTRDLQVAWALLGTSAVVLMAIGIGILWGLAVERRRWNDETAEGLARASEEEKEDG